MAAITANNPTLFQFKGPQDEGMVLDLPVAASTTIYKDSFVGIHVTGYLISYIPAEQAVLATGCPFVGIAITGVDNSAGSDGDKSCRVMVDGYFEYPVSGLVQSDIGKPIFALDNATLTELHVPSAVATGGGYELVGQIVSIPSAGTALVHLGGPLARQGYAAGLLTKTRRIDIANVVNDEVRLLYEAENHNGLYLVSVNGFTTEAVTSTGSSAVVTIYHTWLGANTTLGCTVTFANGTAVRDLVVGAGGVFTGVTAADGDVLVLIPAGYGVIAKVTTVANGGTIKGAADLTATFAIR